jgi:hypothetical protein
LLTLRFFSVVGGEEPGRGLESSKCQSAAKVLSEEEEEEVYSNAAQNQTSQSSKTK